MDRRAFIRSASLTASAGMLATLPACPNGSRPDQRGPARRTPGPWGRVRDEFEIDPAYVHLAGMLLAPHPRPVREAIARHREGLDRNPVDYMTQHGNRLERRSRDAAAQHIGGATRDLGLTDSTTMGIGLVYNGVRIREGQEMLTSDHDYHATHTALRYRAERSGASIRRIPLYADVRRVSAGEIVRNVLDAVTPRTRVLAATWVHSKTGLKLPAAEIAEALATVNRGRTPEDRVLFCLDGVHGFGVEDDAVPDLGCDFFFAGAHKWMFAPRGTGIVWGRPETQDQVGPTIPTFTRDGTWGGSMTPGGFKPFEHQWSMAEAFQFHQDIGTSEIRARIHGLARHLKEGLRGIDGVTLWTPMDEALSSGIVCFDVDGLSPRQVVDRLAGHDIIASVTPYAPPHARFSPGLLNTDEEMERALEAVRAIA